MLALSRGRNLSSSSHVQLNALIRRLPMCPSRNLLLDWIDMTMHAFSLRCSWDETHLTGLLLVRNAAERGADVPSLNPISAARDAASCSRSCAWQTSELLKLCVLLTELAVLTCISPSHRANLVDLKENDLITGSEPSLSESIAGLPAAVLPLPVRTRISSTHSHCEV